MLYKNSKYFLWTNLQEGSIVDKHKFSISLMAITLSVATVLGGCDKKEPSDAPAPEVAPAPQAAAPAEPVPVAPEPAPATGGAAAVTAGDAETMMKSSDCFACHSVDTKLVGPAYSWIAYRFKDDQAAPTKLAAAIKNGSSGQWTAYTGGVAMPAHPQLSDEQIQAMVKWVLEQKPVEAPKM